MSATRTSRHKEQTGGDSVSERVLRNYHVKLKKKLNVTILRPYLNEYHLITADFHEELTLQATHAAKVDRLVAELPRSGTDFLERFIQCLRESVEETGTYHGEIANALEELKLQELETSATLSVQILSCELESVSNWYQLGIKLGLKPYQLKQIEEKTTTDIEHRKIEMYDLWLRTTPEASWNHIVTALREMEEITTAERIQQNYGVTGLACNTATNVADFSEDASAMTPLLVGTEQPHQSNNDEEVRRLTNNIRCCNRWRRWCCCYTVVIAILISLAIVITILYKEPHVSPSVCPNHVFRNSTVKLLFDHSPWLSEIQLSMDTNCGAKLYQLQDQDCSTLPTLNTSYVDPNDKADYIYMLPGSVIDFTINSDAQGEVWVFSDYDTLHEFNEDHPRFDCHQPPPGAYCFEAENHPGTYPYYIQQPAYYSIRLPLFNGKINWYFHRVIYDRDAITKYPNIGVLTPVPITLYFPFPYKMGCILVDFPAGSPCNSGVVKASNAIRQQHYLIFPGILLGAGFIILIVLTIVHVLYCYCRRSSS